MPFRVGFPNFGEARLFISKINFLAVYSSPGREDDSSSRVDLIRLGGSGPKTLAQAARSLHLLKRRSPEKEEDRRRKKIDAAKRRKKSRSDRGEDDGDDDPDYEPGGEGREDHAADEVSRKCTKFAILLTFKCNLYFKTDYSHAKPSGACSWNIKRDC